MGVDRSQRAVFEFILMRAFRKGVVKRGDVLNAFDRKISETRASELLRSALEKYPALIERVGNAVKPRIGATAPSLTSEERLMQAIFSGNDTFAEIGLTAAELPRKTVEWTNNRPIKPGIFQTIVFAIVEVAALDIEYVTLKKADRGNRRSIFPIGLQRMGDQYRLVAYDLAKKPFTQRMYVLSRILEAFPNNVKVPPSLRHNSFDAIESISTPLNSALTPAQRLVIEHELNVQEGRRQMPASEEFEFLRRYGGIGVSQNAVWPIIDRDTLDE